MAHSLLGHLGHAGHGDDKARSNSRQHIKDDDYWKVSDGLSIKPSRIKWILDERHYHINKSASAQQLHAALYRSNRGLLSYGSMKNPELLEMLERRGIDADHVTKGPRKGQRDALIKLLTDEDDDPKFHRFRELPAELRNRIYDLHFADLHQPIRAPVQPPITMVSSMIRSEALGLFYHNCTFDFPLMRIAALAAPAGPLLNRLMFKSDLMHFINQTPVEYPGAVQSFRMHLRRYEWNDEDLFTHPILIKLSNEGPKYEIELETRASHQENTIKATEMTVIEQEVRKVLDGIVARDGKDRLRAGDFYDLRRAWEKGLAA